MRLPVTGGATGATDVVALRFGGGALKQVLIRRGGVVVEEVPVPLLDDNGVLVEVCYSLISPGTEIAGVEQSRKSLVRKGLEQPEKARKLLAFLRERGIRKTVAYLRSLSEGGVASGYSCAGLVLRAGRNVRDLSPGERVACAGASKASHAEIVVVPRNLVVPVPGGCDLRDAASVALGSIALQGIRRAEARLGEIVAVIGLGLLGQITVQLLKAAGCRVLGLDPDRRRVIVARQLGADLALSPEDQDPGTQARHLSGGHGVDAAILTAASRSDSLVQTAMEMTRRKGRVVVVGDVGLRLKRSPFYEKEIDLRISCSSGPGRYDPAYEERGLDYPYAHVRWTENRNMAEYLRLVAEGRVNVKALVEREYDVTSAAEAYRELGKGSGRPLGVLLGYAVALDAPAATASAETRRSTAVTLRAAAPEGRPRLAVVGAGGFAKEVHLPNLQRLVDQFHLRAVVSASGANAKATASRFGADYATTDYERVLSDPDVDAVLICTRHHLHARQAIAAAKASKAILLEKPMALHKAELDELVAVLRQMQVPFMVGYNRRFSPFAVAIRQAVSRRSGPLFIHYRMNAAYVSPDHWVHGEEGGGRIVGEACHIVDLFTSLTGSRILSVSAARLRPAAAPFASSDNVVAALEYDDGSVATLEYFSVGSNRLPKERMEVHFDEKSIVMDNYQSLTGYGVRVAVGGPKGSKGHLEELKAFHAALAARLDEMPIPLWDLIQTAEATFAIDADV